MKKISFFLPLWIGVLAASLLAGIGAAQEGPAIPLHDLQEGKVRGFDEVPAQATDILTKKYGRVRAGWALPVERGETIEFTLETDPDALGPEWTEPQRDGGTLSAEETVEWSLPGGALSRSLSGGFRLIAPDEAGNAPLEMTLRTTVAHDETPLPSRIPARVEVMIMVKAPFYREGNGMIGNYPVGIYPNEKGAGASSFVQRHVDLYRPPESFLYVTPETEDLHISEHFKVGDFSPRTERGKPHFIALDRRLIDFLEEAVAALPKRFGEADDGMALRLLAAFLSPNHLARLRSEGARFAEFTRYQYGDAAAVIWDADGDGVMDDLNDDGQTTEEDAQILADELIALQKRLKKFGGVGTVASSEFPETEDTPYVGLDLRGVASRW